jgi:DNA replication regulator SLD2
MLAGLRQIQEEALDDDLDVLREMENETSQTAPGQPKPGLKPSSLPANNIKMPEVQVEDSQVAHFPLGGFDDEGQYDSEPEDPTAGLDRNGQPLPVYKKRGQKRTTRKVNIKPVRAKLVQPKPSSFSREYNDTDDEEESGRDRKHGEDGAPDLIPDTQHPGFDSTSLPLFAKDDDCDPESSGSEYTASNGGTRYRKPDQSGRRSKRMAGKVEILGGKAGANADAEGDGDGKEGMVEKAKTKMRKVGTQVSANYKRLKLRNTGAKGGRVGGRFGKRR